MTWGAPDGVDSPSGWPPSHDPTTGRFLTTDPVKCPTGQPEQSAYGYANGNPVWFVDPSGRESQPPSQTKEYSVGGCVGGVVIFLGSEFVGTTFVAGGVLLMGFSCTLVGVTFGGATPVTAAGVVAATALDVAGLAIDVGGAAALTTFCSAQQP